MAKTVGDWFKGRSVHVLPSKLYWSMLLDTLSCIARPWLTPAPKSCTLEMLPLPTPINE